MRDVLVRAQELGGRWVSLGADAARGIVVENLSADVDTWGPRACSFVLRRRIDVPWPDIGAFSPLEIFDQGTQIWSGRVKGTPTSDGTDRSITVNGEGWQYHLDDDVMQKAYVHTDLSAWVDARSLPATPLGATSFAAGAIVGVDGGAITLKWPATTPEPTGASMGIVLDLGADNKAAAFSVFSQSSNNTGNDFLYIRAYDTAPLATTATGTAFEAGVNTTYFAGFINGVFSTPARYVGIFSFCATGYTPLADVWWRFPQITIYASSAYMLTPTTVGTSSYSASDDYSIIKASTIVADAKAQATLLLSSDVSKIQATTFQIPTFTMSAPSTPRDVITAANAYHAWQPRVNADKLLEYRPLPASPVVQVDQRSTFDEASSGDASEIYSDVRVSFTDGGGNAQSVLRGQPATTRILSTVQPTNPSATVDTSNWTTTGTLTRDTVGGEWTTTPAGFKLVTSSSGGYATTSAWTGALQAGKTYSLDIDALYTASTGLGVAVEVWVDGVMRASAVLPGSGAFVTSTATWVQPSASAPVIYVRPSPFSVPGLVLVSVIVLFDNLLLYESATTVVNRWGFKRTKVLDTNMALTPAGAQQIGDVYLPNHKTTPLKGQLTVSGYGTARQATSGQRMSTAELLLQGGELVRFMHLIDPDTGSLGREGRIASVSWDAMSDTSTIEIDSQSTNFEAMLSRLALVTGQVT